MRNARLTFALALLIVFLTAFSFPPRGIIVLCAGDSLTDSEYPRHLRRLLVGDGWRTRVLNCGRKGNTSGEFLRYLKQEAPALRRERPDFILLQLGTNDVRVDSDHTSVEAFAGNMRAIIGLFREFTDRRGERARILLATVPPLPERYSSPFGPGSAGRVVKEINPLVRQIAAEERLVLVDNYAVFLGSPELLPDVHPTSEGYRRLARNWYESLKPLLPGIEVR